MSRVRPSVRASVLAVLLGSACASPGLPPGGPPDAKVPEIVRITPDTNAVNVKASAVLVHFDEVIAERPSAGAGRPGGAADLSSVVSLSPSDGRDQVTWRRTAIEIRPRRGFRPNTGYRVSIQPGIADLRGNIIREPMEFVFSTGPSLPDGALSGVVFDYAAAKSAPLAQVELFTAEDTTFRWMTRADSSGRFTLRDLTPGSYLLRGYVDGNNDRRLGLREAYDTMRVTLPATTPVELYAFVRDTLSPRVEAVDPIDSTGLKLRFDRVVQGDWNPAVDAVTLVGADSMPIALVGRLMPAQRFDSLAKVARDAAAAAAADSTVADVDADPADDPEPIEEPDDAVAERDSVPTDLEADTLATLPPPTFGRVAPIQQWSIGLEAPLAPGLYRLRVVGAPGLNGIARETEREFRIREPEPVKETEPPGDAPAAAAPVTPPPGAGRPLGSR